MNMDKINSVLEAKVMPLANKMSGQRHLRAIRDAYRYYNQWLSAGMGSFRREKQPAA